MDVWFQDKEADFTSSSGVGVRNTIYALLLSGLYEVLIEFNISLAQFEYVKSSFVHCCIQQIARSI